MTEHSHGPEPDWESFELWLEPEVITNLSMKYASGCRDEKNLPHTHKGYEGYQHD